LFIKDSLLTCNPAVHYCVHSSPPLVFILSHLSSVDRFTLNSNTSILKLFSNLNLTFVKFKYCKNVYLKLAEIKVTRCTTGWNLLDHRKNEDFRKN